MKLNIVLQFDFEGLDNTIKRFKEVAKEKSENLDNLFLIMSTETGRGFADGILGVPPSHYKGIKIAYCDSVEYGTVYIK